MALKANALVHVTDLFPIKGAAYFAHWSLPTKQMGILETAMQNALKPGVLDQRVFRMGKKVIPFPRLTSLVAGPAEVAAKIQYTYSGGQDVAKPASTAQLALLKYLNDMFGYEPNCQFNSWLLNYYNRGDKSSIGRHQDDERDLASGSLVAGISWIENPDQNIWRFRLRSVQPLDTSGKKPKSKWVNHILKHGECFCMGGPLFQHRKFGWTHEIPKGTAKAPHPDHRLSFTARRLIAPVKPVKRKASSSAEGTAKVAK